MYKTVKTLHINGLRTMRLLVDFHLTKTNDESEIIEICALDLSESCDKFTTTVSSKDWTRIFGYSLTEAFVHVPYSEMIQRKARHCQILVNKLWMAYTSHGYELLIAGQEPVGRKRYLPEALAIKEIDFWRKKEEKDKWTSLYLQCARQTASLCQRRLEKQLEARYQLKNETALSLMSIAESFSSQCIHMALVSLTK